MSSELGGRRLLRCGSGRFIFSTVIKHVILTLLQSEYAACIFPLWLHASYSPFIFLTHRKGFPPLGRWRFDNCRMQNSLQLFSTLWKSLRCSDQESTRPSAGCLTRQINTRKICKAPEPYWVHQHLNFLHVRHKKLGLLGYPPYQELDQQKSISSRLEDSLTFLVIKIQTREKWRPEKAGQESWALKIMSFTHSWVTQIHNQPHCFSVQLSKWVWKWNETGWMSTVFMRNAQYISDQR